MQAFYFLVREENSYTDGASNDFFPSAGLMTNDHAIRGRIVSVLVVRICISD